MEYGSDDILIAQLHLRLGHTLLDAQIYWPPSACARAGTSLVLLLVDETTPRGVKSGDVLGHVLSAGANLVVLRVHDRTHSVPALMWAADHAHELGGRPDRLMVAGCGVSGAWAARVAMNARDRGWPVPYRQVLVHPRFMITCPPPQRVVGVAPATIVSASGPRDHARRYAARLKRSGVEVCELREPYSWRGQPVFERQLIADLANSLRKKGSTG
jgi:alpha/beta hydrolase fold